MFDATKLSDLFRQSLPFFTALGDETRQQLLLLMMDGVSRSVAELTAETKLSRPAISHHLRIMKTAGIIIEHKKGRQIYYQPTSGQYFETVKELINQVDEALKCKKDIA